ncbi:sugar phosphate isomerase/epimerase [Pedobacter sp. JCM 36344]|uniref:sugar phosphate isomerase/epimerase n=1 Tax=Pedobacter sp. JCM 36344 TaxID=3374280 RepID=UPI00397DCC16
MQIKFFCPHWGHEHLSKQIFAAKVSAAGYDGVEMVVATNKKEKSDWKKQFNEHQLLFIAQVTAAGKDGGFEEHLKETTYYLENAMAMDPLKINSFTGRDYFSFEQNMEIIQMNLTAASTLGIPLVHEIHRGRFSFSAATMKPYLDACSTLRLNADFSHWCCVSESYLQENELSELMKETIRRSYHIHARVGYPQGPQVNDPRAPEWKDALNYHLTWWDEIVSLHYLKGTALFTITPEFGPAPYLNALPYTQKPVADQWKVNIWMMDLLKKRYSKYTQ